MRAAPDLDELAKRMGYKDAATMAAYYRHQQEMKSAPAATASGPMGGAASSSSSLDQAFSWHPAVLLKLILDKWNKAAP